MPFKKILERELQVAFSRQSQPAWFRVLKYVLLGLILYFFWGTKYLWIILVILLVFALLVQVQNPGMDEKLSDVET